MQPIGTRIRADLAAMRDADYAAFTARLIPNIDAGRILGVRMPQLRRYAKTLLRDPERDAFLAALPHETQEENILHALLLSQMAGDFDAVLPKIQRFLPYIDNWAVTDCFSPRCFDAEREKTYAFCLDCLDSAHPYTVRFGIVTLLMRFLQEGFDPAILPRLAALPAGEYYVDMAVAWYLSQALAYQYDAVLPAIEGGIYSRFVHNKAIQKAIESYRVSEAHKTYLRTLRRGKDTPEAHKTKETPQ